MEQTDTPQCIPANYEHILMKFCGGEDNGPRTNHSHSCDDPVQNANEGFLNADWDPGILGRIFE